MSNEVLGLVLLGLLFVIILGGFPISFTLIFLATIFGYAGIGEPVFNLITFQAWHTLKDTVLSAVAMFTFMGYILQSAGLMNRLFRGVQLLFGGISGSLYLTTLIAGLLFAAATGIVGASVTILGLMAAPVMLRAGYDDKLTAGTICAAGTLGILVPPSIMLVVMGPVMSVSVVRLFAAALVPGVLLVTLYATYIFIRVWLNPNTGPALNKQERNVSTGFILQEIFFGLIPIATLIVATLGSIVSGWATPTEGAALGCFGAVLVTAFHKQLTWKNVQDAVYRTVLTTSMVMVLLLASNVMGAVFSALGSPSYIAQQIVEWGISPSLLVLAILFLCFLLGGPLEWVPIVVIVLPIFYPILAEMNVNMIWFSILVAVVLQTAWLTPPVGMSAYYLKAVIPGLDLWRIYVGMAPFVVLQWVGVFILYFFPKLVLVVPEMLYGN